MAAVRPRARDDATASGSDRAPAVTEDSRSVRRRVEAAPAHIDASSSSQLPAQAYEDERAASAAAESRAAPAAAEIESAPDDRDEDDFDMEEYCGAKVMTAPAKPTQPMIDEHEAHRLPFRSWPVFVSEEGLHPSGISK